MFSLTSKPLEAMNENDGRGRADGVNRPLAAFLALAATPALCKKTELTARPGVPRTAAVGTKTKLQTKAPDPRKCPLAATLFDTAAAGVSTTTPVHKE